MNARQNCYTVGLYVGTYVICAPNTQPEQPKQDSARELRRRYDERAEWFEALYAGVSE